MDEGKVIRWENVKESVEHGHINWRKFFDERQLKEISFSDLYYQEYSHGTEGHNAKIVIAKMAMILDAMSNGITFTPDEPK